MKCLFNNPESQEQSPESLTIQSRDVPKPGPEEVLVRVEASSVNRLDLLQAQGKYPVPPGVTPVGGMDCQGYVVDPVTLKPVELMEDGKPKPIMVLLSGGAYGDYATCPKNHLMDVPNNLKGETLCHAAAIPEVWLTAYQLLKFILEVKENQGKIALVYAAASGVGTSLIQLCKMMGIKSISVASSQEKLDVCKQLGSDYQINYKGLSKEDFTAQVMEFTGNKGVDYILDPISASNFEQNIACLAMDCRWVVFGGMGGMQLNFPNVPGGEKCGLNLSLIMKKRACLLTTTLRGRSIEYKTELKNSFEERCKSKFESGELKLTIDEPKYNYSNIQQAFKKMADNQNIGKIIVINDMQ